jgi:hypothetical protein
LKLSLNLLDLVEISKGHLIKYYPVDRSLVISGHPALSKYLSEEFGLVFRGGFKTDWPDGQSFCYKYFGLEK